MVALVITAQILVGTCAAKTVIYFMFGNVLKQMVGKQNAKLRALKMCNATQIFGALRAPKMCNACNKAPKICYRG